MGRPPLGSVRVRAPETFECELTRKLQELEGRKKPSNDAAAGKTDSLMLRRRPRPLGNVEAMLEHGEELEGLSRALSWWDLPEDERMVSLYARLSRTVEYCDATLATPGLSADLNSEPTCSPRRGFSSGSRLAWRGRERRRA